MCISCSICINCKICKNCLYYIFKFFCIFTEWLDNIGSKQGSDPSVSFRNQSPKKKISQRKSIATQSKSIKLAHAPTRVYGSKSGQNKVCSSSPPSRIEKDVAISYQPDYPTEPRCSDNLKICLMDRSIYTRSFQPLQNLLPARQFQWH